MAEIAVTLTREDWERVASWLIDEADDLDKAARITAFHETWEYCQMRLPEIKAINRAICEQAGLPEVFRCE